MMPTFLASAGIPTCVFFLGGCLLFTQGGWGSLAAAFVFSFFLAVGGSWFYLGSHLAVSMRTRTESWHPVRETPGCSRTHAGDAVTACIPLLWSVSLLAHATETAAGFEDGAAGSLITVSICGYQWGWSYVIPNDVLAAWRASSVLAGHGAAFGTAGLVGGHAGAARALLTLKGEVTPHSGLSLLTLKGEVTPHSGLSAFTSGCPVRAANLRQHASSIQGPGAKRGLGYSLCFNKSAYNRFGTFEAWLLWSTPTAAPTGVIDPRLTVPNVVPRGPLGERHLPVRLVELPGGTFEFLPTARWAPTERGPRLSFSKATPYLLDPGSGVGLAWALGPLGLDGSYRDWRGQRVTWAISYLLVGKDGTPVCSYISVNGKAAAPYPSAAAWLAGRASFEAYCRTCRAYGLSPECRPTLTGEQVTAYDRQLADLREAWFAATTYEEALPDGRTASRRLQGLASYSPRQSAHRTARYETMVREGWAMSEPFNGRVYFQSPHTGMRSCLPGNDLAEVVILPGVDSGRGDGVALTDKLPVGVPGKSCLSAVSSHSSGTGTVVVKQPKPGTTSVHSSGTGTIAVKQPKPGTTSVHSSGTGTIAVKQPKPGTTSVHSSGTGTITVKQPKPGTTSVHSSGTITVKQPKPGTTSVHSSGTGTITVKQPKPGTTSVHSSGTGTIAVKQPKPGTTSVHSSGTGTITVKQPKPGTTSAGSRGVRWGLGVQHTVSPIQYQSHHWTKLHLGEICEVVAEFRSYRQVALHTVNQLLNQPNPGSGTSTAGVPFDVLLWELRLCRALQSTSLERAHEQLTATLISVLGEPAVRAATLALPAADRAHHSLSGVCARLTVQQALQVASALALQDDAESSMAAVVLEHAFAWGISSATFQQRTRAWLAELGSEARSAAVLQVDVVSSCLADAVQAYGESQGLLHKRND